MTDLQQEQLNQLRQKTGKDLSIYGDYVVENLPQGQTKLGTLQDLTSGTIGTTSAKRYNTGQAGTYMGYPTTPLTSEAQEDIYEEERKRSQAQARCNIF
jgi:hypothetical protein